jgi:uncharacterized small protein (DUF1192 family)
MNDDIISRLQEVPGGVAEDAIVEITNLKAENARLRAENAKLAASNHAYLSDYQEARGEIEKLRAALGEKDNAKA